jgi:hypothetical protein
VTTIKQMLSLLKSIDWCTIFCLSSACQPCFDFKNFKFDLAMILRIELFPRFPCEVLTYAVQGHSGLRSWRAQLCVSLFPPHSHFFFSSLLLLSWTTRDHR